MNKLELQHLFKGIYRGTLERVSKILRKTKINENNYFFYLFAVYSVKASRSTSTPSKTHLVRI